MRIGALLLGLLAAARGRTSLGPSRRQQRAAPDELLAARRRTTRTSRPTATAPPTARAWSSGSTTAPYVTVLVRDGDGTAVRRVRSRESRRRGRHVWRWDGRSRRGRVLPDGRLRRHPARPGAASGTSRRVDQHRRRDRAATPAGWSLSRPDRLPRCDSGRRQPSRTVYCARAAHEENACTAPTTATGRSGCTARSWSWTPTAQGSRRTSTEYTTRLLVGRHATPARPPLGRAPTRLRVRSPTKPATCARSDAASGRRTRSWSSGCGPATVPAALGRPAGRSTTRAATGCGEVVRSGAERPVPRRAELPAAVQLRLRRRRQYFAADVPPDVPAPVDAYRVSATGGPTHAGRHRTSRHFDGASSSVLGTRPRRRRGRTSTWTPTRTSRTPGVRWLGRLDEPGERLRHRVVHPRVPALRAGRLVTRRPPTAAGQPALLIIPAPTVTPVASSTRMNDPVVRFLA